MTGSSVFDYVHVGDHQELAEQLGLQTPHSCGIVHSPSHSDDGSTSRVHSPSLPDRGRWWQDVELAGLILGTGQV